MKKMFFIVMVMTIATSSDAQFERATLQATGLTCAMCSNAIHKALLEVPFIESVKSDIKNSAFNMVFRNDKEVSIDALRKAVEDAGFSVGNLKMTGNFRDLKIKKDQHVVLGKEVFHFLDVRDQVLNGESTFTVVDKNFLSARQFKKISSASGMACVQTGKAETCCLEEGVPVEARVYHVTI
ncbi:MAG: heavy-metal-associated domain-containing protein [Chitinophagaceae bacterium]